MNSGAESAGEATGSGGKNLLPKVEHPHSVMI